MLGERVVRDYGKNSAKTPASILCVGLGWFPQVPGGLNRYVYELTHHLAAGQDRVELCAVGLPSESNNSQMKLTNLAPKDLPTWKQLWLSRGNFARGWSEKPDAINLHFAMTSFPLLNLLPKGVPVTFSFHGPWALESKQEGDTKLGSWLKYWLVEKQVYTRCDRFIVLSQAFGNILHEKYQVPQSKIDIIPGGVDLNRFPASLSRQQARDQLGWSQDRLILFTPRRLVQRMGIDKLLNALAIIKPKISDVWLAIAGKGWLKDALEEQATALGLNEHVKFLGFLPDEQLPIAYQAADLCVIPSQSLEGFGLILLESLASGTPVMCTPIGGMPEILAPFSPDLITSGCEPTAIAERLENILNGEVHLPSREACREYAVTNFDWDKIAHQVRQVLLA
ncbi:MAG: glycosyltransferase family 4 protein [Nostocaceae cyanobacterium]|nr:glycosyltransferase family 4 protein [Nostocaceae cyanobacterium]